MDFDFYWVNDDLADTKATFMSRAMYQEFFLPYQKMVAKAIQKPWVYHSDGNLMPIIDDLLTLGMAGLHPIQPAAMDIEKVKSLYGKRICILGNIDLDYTLTQGTPEEVEREVKDRIAVAGVGGGYIITSANSLPDYCKTENVWAMSKAIRKYGKYPLDPALRP
jgi:uroporphyrinogen decarboxylase